MPRYQVAVIGLGPCGISTAIYLKRYGHDVVLIGLENTSLNKAHLIENYYGILSISGTDLFQMGMKQAKNLDIPIYEDEVLAIEYLNDDEFLIKTNNNEITATKVVLALGSAKREFPLAKKFEGNGVSYCATCDGFLYRKKRVGILGSSLYMKHEYEVLKNIIPNLTIFTNNEKLAFEVSNPVVNDKIVALKGDEYLEGIVTENGEYPLDGLFVAMGSQNAFTLAMHLGLALDSMSIVVDEHYQTNIRGIYAGGDCIKGLHQVIKAASDGAIIALEISKELKK